MIIYDTPSTNIPTVSGIEAYIIKITSLSDDSVLVISQQMLTDDYPSYDVHTV